MGRSEAGVRLCAHHGIWRMVGPETPIEVLGLLEPGPAAWRTSAAKRPRWLAPPLVHNLASEN
jgi:hypothetical protein